MTESQPSPPQEHPPQVPPPPSVPGSEGSSPYNKLTDKVGCLSIRLGDNLASLLGAAVGLVAGCLIGAGMLKGVMPSAHGSIPILLGGVLGVIAGVFLVGLILMIVGIARK